jgi:hypothetical protein
LKHLKWEWVNYVRSHRTLSLKYMCLRLLYWVLAQVSPPLRSHYCLLIVCYFTPSGRKSFCLPAFCLFLICLSIHLPIQYICLFHSSACPVCCQFNSSACSIHLLVQSSACCNHPAFLSSAYSFSSLCNHVHVLSSACSNHLTFLSSAYQFISLSIIVLVLSYACTFICLSVHVCVIHLYRVPVHSFVQRTLVILL